MLVLDALERFLARLAAGPYAGTFVLKGGMLLAALSFWSSSANAAQARSHGTA